MTVVGSNVKQCAASTFHSADSISVGAVLHTSHPDRGAECRIVQYSSDCHSDMLKTLYSLVEGVSVM